LFNRAQAIAHVGNWDWEMAGDRFFWSDETYRVFGVDPAETPASRKALMEAILPKDRLKPSEILGLVRLHWGVENGCHWTMVVILGEDDHALCTKGRAVRMLSWMRLMAYNMLRLLKNCYLRAEKNRTMPWDNMRRYITQAFQNVLAWRELCRDEAQLATP